MGILLEFLVIREIDTPIFIVFLVGHQAKYFGGGMSSELDAAQIGEGNLPTSQSPVLDRQKIGKQLLIAAWSVEVLAATIGLLIAVLVILGTQQAIGESGVDGRSHIAGFMNAFLGGLPFIVIAAVELTKIPLATACYHAENRAWQVILLVGILCLAGITFETILNGFERNFTQRTYVLKQIKNKLITTEEEIQKIESDIKTLAAVTSETLRQEHGKELEQIEGNRLAELNDIDNQIQSARITYSGREADALREQKTQVESVLEKLDVEYANARLRTDSDFERSLTNIKETLDQKRSAIVSELVELRKDLKRLSASEQAEIVQIKDVTQNNDELRSELKRIEADFSNRVNDIRNAITAERAKLEQGIEVAKTELQFLISKRDSEIETENSARAFVPKSEIIVEVSNKYRQRIDASQTEIGTLSGALRNLSVADGVSNLQKEKDAALETARADFQSINNQGSVGRANIKRKYSQEARAKDARIGELARESAGLNTQSLNASASKRRNAALQYLKTNFDQRRNVLSKKHDDLAQKLASALRSTEDSLKPLLKRLSDHRAEIVAQYENQRKAAQDGHSSRRNELAEREIQLASLRSTKGGLGDQRLQYRDDITKLAEDSQIFRVAALWTGKDSPADVTNEELRLISLIWFGSLAAITAWTGTLLAFGGLAVQFGRRPENPELPNARRKLLQSLRRLTITLRRQRMRPREKTIEKEIEVIKEIVKEIPVDRVVLKEVPVEVVRRELVYVPFFSDDPKYMEGQSYAERWKAGDPDLKTDNDRSGHPERKSEND
jgi:hypothetical protein